MTRAVFESKRTDAAGRLGRLEIPRADVTVETPAMLPVVNPHVQGIEPRRLAEEFGVEILITNAYVLYGSDDLREDALERGVHDLLDFPGAIMTDSGSFQLAEYGNIDVDTPEILSFQDRIGADIATPVDVPTPPDADRDTAEADLEATMAALRHAADYEPGAMLRTGPIQGSTYPDLRERAAREADALDLEVYPIGAMVPLLRAYRFDEMVELVDAAKRGLGTDAPVHLFGAGHPMMFALAVALGCDLFDSAAYALYAREGRYLTPAGTSDLEDLAHFPCACPVCTSQTPKDLAACEESQRERRLAAHNLHVTMAEIRRIKQAITRGELLELVERRVRAHPRLLDGYRAALPSPRLRAEEPATSARPMFYLSSESATRPEVLRHHDRLRRVEVPGEVTLLEHTLSDEQLPASLEASAPQWAVAPPFGPIPPALEQTYPLTAELPHHPDRAAIDAAVTGIRALVTGGVAEGRLIHDDWPAWALARLPDAIHPIAAEEAA